MRQNKSYNLAAGMFLSLFLLISGCSKNAIDIEKLEKSDPNVKLALIKVPGQTETYSLNIFIQRKVSVEGPARENAMNFGGGQTSNNIEMVFESLVQSVNPEGNAIEQITIKELKYKSVVRDEVQIDYDSSKDKNPDNALFALIGQSYTIEVTPSGQVAKIVDISNALKGLESAPSNKVAATGLLSESSIKSRHSIPLPDANDNKVKTDKTWSSEVSFNFDRMGSSSFEKTYKLDKIIKDGGNLTALISMNAIPSAGSSTPPMADVRPTYTGSMELNITKGTLIKYQENLVNEWVMVFPDSDSQESPSVINMTAARLHDIEKIK